MKISSLIATFVNLQDGRLTYDPGSRVVQLPFINYLRQLGATFLNAYTNSPICCPSRAGCPLKYLIKHRLKENKSKDCDAELFI